MHAQFNHNWTSQPNKMASDMAIPQESMGKVRPRCPSDVATPNPMTGGCFLGWAYL